MVFVTASKSCVSTYAHLATVTLAKTEDITDMPWLQMSPDSTKYKFLRLPYSVQWLLALFSTKHRITVKMDNQLMEAGSLQRQNEQAFSSLLWS